MSYQHVLHLPEYADKIRFNKTNVVFREGDVPTLMPTLSEGIPS